MKDLQQQLIATAKANPPSELVPYAFEKRVMALLKDCKPVDPIQLMNHYFVGAALCSILVAGGLAGFSVMMSDDNTMAKPQAASFSQDVEQTIYAAVELPGADPEMP